MENRKTIRPVLIASQRTVAEQAAFLQRLLVGLADESISSALLCPPGCHDDRFAPMPAEVLVYPVVDLPILSSLGFESLASQLEKFRPTVIHCLCESRATLAWRLARRLDLPYVLSVNSLVRRHHMPALSPGHCAGIIVPAETIGDSLTKAHAPLIARVRRINRGTFVEGEPACFTNPGHLTSLIVAEPVKSLSGHIDLFKAIETLLADGEDFMTVVIGRGRIERQIREVLAECGLSQAVTIIPPLEPCRAVLAAGDIYVQPQARTTFSSWLLEAMSVGTAVAACRGGVDDLIIHNDTALVFDPNDQQSIRVALKRFFDDHDFARQLARQAQSHLRKYHSVTAMIEAVLETYEQGQRQYSNGSTASVAHVSAS